MERKPHSLEFETTMLSSNRVWHYTCNPPSDEICKRTGIEGIGNHYGCENNNGVLLIPKRLYEKTGQIPSNDKVVLRIQTENLLRRLDS